MFELFSLSFPVGAPFSSLLPILSERYHMCYLKYASNKMSHKLFDMEGRKIQKTLTPVTENKVQSYGDEGEDIPS